MLLEEVVPTYQERLANYWKKMFQRVRNLLQVTYCNPPTKKCAKVTTVPPLHGRRHHKHSFEEVVLLLTKDEIRCLSRT
jgi:hypothetical protein